MGPGMFDGMLEGFAVICVVIGFAIGGIVFFVIPWLWGALKPWIHTVTG